MKKAAPIKRQALKKHHNSSYHAKRHGAYNRVGMGQGFWYSLRTLDGQNQGSWPWFIKVLAAFSIVVTIAALAYAVPISSKMAQIGAAEAEQETLLEVYRKKESKARHLEAYKAQVRQMEVEFTALLDQLPKDTRVSDLVEGINLTGMDSGIRFKDISIEPEIEQPLFIEQPIRIEAVGDYHQFGAFVSRLAALPRIITMADFQVTNAKPSLDTLPELSLILHTSTYRSKETVKDTMLAPDGLESVEDDES